MDTVRFGIIGIGNMGSFHANTFGELKDAKLTCICDADEKRLAAMGEKHAVPTFNRYQDLIASGLVDAVLIATPHWFHPQIAIAAFEAGLHVLSEKPEAVTVNDARRMNAVAARYPNQKYGIMFQMRTGPFYKKVRDLVLSGDLGEINRVTWIATNWLRTWAYYASGGWRATWAGEGGGVLLNQCPHNLDQLFWLTNMMPSRITAVASIGKTHPIEVEDEVSAIMEYPNGAIGHFITTTGEAPGTDRLEIIGDRAKMVLEAGRLTLKLLRKGTRELRETSPESFPHVEAWDVEVPVNRNQPEGHKIITQNFINAILRDEPLISPGEEGIKGLEIGNAMLMSGITRKPVDLPIDGDAFDAFIKDLTQKYGGRKKLDVREAQANMGESFGGKQRA